MIDSTSEIENPISKILFLAGDVSGDEHLARLMRILQSRHADWQLLGVGGSAMKAINATMLGDSSGSGVIGLVPSLMLVPRLIKLRHRVLDWCETTRPDLVVMCDWGAFNARLLKPLQKLGIEVLYYFPPSSWRKNGARGLSIAPFVSRVATPFEWSAQRFQDVGCNAEWVGHPVLETLKPLDESARKTLRASFGVDENEKLVALLPGSRALELKYIAPHLRHLVDIYHASSTRTSTKFFVGAAPNATAKLRKVFGDSASGEKVQIVEGRTGELLQACDAAIVKSGTSTVEAAVANAPQVVVYDGPKILEWQWKLMGGTKKTPFVAMPNIIAEREIVRELLAENCRAPIIFDELQMLLNDNAKRARIQSDYVAVRRALGSELPHGATERTAQIVEEMIDSGARLNR